MILLVIVRLGAAWAKHVEEWLDVEGLQRCKSNAKNSNVTETTLRADLGTVDSIDSCKPKTDRELNLSDNISDDISDDISDFTDPTVNLTDRTELIDVRKRLMSDSEDLQYTTFPQLEASALLASSTESTTTPLSTSSNNS